MSQCEKVNINGVYYIREDVVNSQQTAQRNEHGYPFVIIRSQNAGVFAGYLKECDNKNQSVQLDGCIRLWRWTGCSLSQVAVDGISGNGENKFSVETNGHIICQVIEIIPCTEKARLAIQGEKKWKL